MIIIWGSRWRHVQEGHAKLECIICKHDMLQVHSVRRWFTIFFIPIFPTSGIKYYLECPSCENSYTLKEGVKVEDILHEETSTETE